MVDEQKYITENCVVVNGCQNFEKIVSLGIAKMQLPELHGIVIHPDSTQFDTRCNFSVKIQKV